MRIAQEKVEQFHERYGFRIGAAPELIPVEESAMRLALMREELDEYQRAVDNGDLTEIGDALADLAYTVLGTAVSHGIKLAPLFDEVHRSNLTKHPADPSRPSKPVKGPDFEPPRIAELLLIQRTLLNDEVV